MNPIRAIPFHLSRATCRPGKAKSRSLANAIAGTGRDDALSRLTFILFETWLLNDRGASILKSVETRRARELLSSEQFCVISLKLFLILVLAEFQFKVFETGIVPESRSGLAIPKVFGVANGSNRPPLVCVMLVGSPSPRVPVETVNGDGGSCGCVTVGCDVTGSGEPPPSLTARAFVETTVKWVIWLLAMEIWVCLAKRAGAKVGVCVGAISAQARSARRLLNGDMNVLMGKLVAAKGKFELKKKELHQLHLDEEVLRETLEEQAMDAKAREEKIRQKQADDDEFFLEFGMVRIDSDYESSN
ncbi:hypothetical protein Tco_0564723 [Tanacetum coccineum]